MDDASPRYDYAALAMLGHTAAAWESATTMPKSQILLYGIMAYYSYYYLISIL